MRKLLSIIAIVLTVACLFTACGVKGSSSKKELETCVTKEAGANRTEFGNTEMKHTFICEITGKDGTISSFIYHTDEENVLDAIKKIGLLQYEGEGDNLSLKFSGHDDVTSYRFYINGELSKDGPLGVAITDNAYYSFVPTDYVPTAETASEAQ